MKVSKTKQSRWIYITLILMVLALISFSILPLVSSIVQARQPDNSGLLATEKARLDNEVLGYQLVLEREPDNPNALQGLLEAKLRQGDLSGSIAPLERLAQIKAQQPDYGILLAQAKQQLKDYEGAIIAYQGILAANPGEMRALKGMVDLLMAQKRSQEAINLVQNTLNQVLQEQSNNPQGTSAFNLTSLQLLLGEIYTQENRYDSATTIYDQAIKADPNDFRPILAKAMLQRQQGKETEAQTLLKEAIMLAPVSYKEQIKAIALEKPQMTSQPSTDK